MHCRTTTPYHFPAIYDRHLILRKRLARILAVGRFLIPVAAAGRLFCWRFWIAAIELVGAGEAMVLAGLTGIMLRL